MMIWRMFADRLPAVALDALSYVSLPSVERYSVTLAAWRISAEDTHGITEVCLYRGGKRIVAWSASSRDVATVERAVALAVEMATRHTIIEV